MSLLKFPSEITFQILLKLNLHDRINVCRTHSRLSPLCFDRLLELKSKATISLKELQQLYQQSVTEKERDQCFNPKTLDRLRTNNFNELVHMNMDPRSSQFFANHKILHSFKGKIILESENEKFSEDFYQQFLSLIERTKGNLLLTLVDVKRYENDYAEQCAQTLSRKLKRGEKVFIMDATKTTSSYSDTHGYDTHGCEIYTNRTFSMQDGSVFFVTSNQNSHYKTLLSGWKKNSGAITEKMIAMINGDRFVAEKKLLESVLPLVKAAELIEDDFFHCPNCDTALRSFVDVISISMDEPFWSNCAGCALK